MHLGKPFHEDSALRRIDLRERDSHAGAWLCVGDLSVCCEFLSHVSDGHADASPGLKRIRRIDVTSVQAQIASTRFDTCVET